MCKFLYSLAWLEMVTLGIRKYNSICNSIEIFGGSLHIHKPIHIHWKPGILLASLLLSLLLNE